MRHSRSISTPVIPPVTKLIMTNQNVIFNDSLRRRDITMTGNRDGCDVMHATSRMI